MAQLIDKSEEICGLCRFRIQDEELVKARYVKKEITAAFDEKRAYPFFADSAIIDSLKSGANHEVYTSSFIALKNRAFDELAENDYPGAVTDEKHIPFIQMRDVKGVGSRINLDYSTSLRNDGNNVDIEKEMVDAAKNLMRYNAFITSLNQNFKVLKMAMRTNG